MTNLFKSEIETKAVLVKEQEHARNKKKKYIAVALDNRSIPADGMNDHQVCDVL